MRQPLMQAPCISKCLQSAALLSAALLVMLPCAGLHADGLPVEYLLSHQWRNLFQSRSPVNNPAFMTEDNYTSVRGALSLATDNVSQLWEIGLTQPLGLYQSFGVSWVAENGLPVEDAGFIGSDNEISFGADPTSTNNHNSFVALSYAINPWRRLSVGVNLNLLHQSRFGDPSQSAGIDAGLSYRLVRHPILGTHVAGVSARNFLFYSVNPAIEKIDAAQINAITHSSFIENLITVDCQFDISDLLTKRSEFLSGQSPSIEWDFYGQVGFWLMRLFTANAFIGLGQQEVEFWGAALGLNIPSVNVGRDFSVSYQIRNELNSDLLPSHSIYFRGDFGKHREEIYARRMARGLALSPNELYNRAMKLYFAGDYWNAYLIFASIKANYPDFFKNDYVFYYMGSCLEALDMREEAITAYEETIQSYPSSELAPNAELGMMRINYRESDLEVAANRYRSLISVSRPSEVSDSLKYHAAYLMGQIALQRGEYAQAIQLLATIPDIHPEYVFAQHTAAIAYILLNNNFERAVSFLENVVNAGGTTKAQKEIVNRSCLLLGYLFYEEDRLARAVTALRMIPPESSYYPEALLGLAWTAMKARQFTDCIASGALLAKTTLDTILQSEGLLLQGYGLVMIKDFVTAEMVIKAGRDRMATYRTPSEDTLELRKATYQKNRVAYHQVAQELVRLGPLGESGFRAKKLDSLYLVPTGIRSSLKNHLTWVDTFNRKGFFGRSASKVREDLEFALVTVQKIRGDKSVDKSRKDRIEQNQINQEIERVRQELEKIKDTQ